MPGRPRTLNEPKRWPRNGQWDLAAAAFGKLVEQEPDNLGSRYPHIRSLVEAGDRAGVQRACEDLLKRFGTTTDYEQSNSIAWCCVLAPDAVVDREALVRLAEAGRGREIRKEGGRGARCSTPSGLRSIAPAGSRKPSAV